MTVGELIDRVREYYVTRLATELRALEESSPLIYPEPAVRSSDGSAKRSGALDLPYRFDACVVEDGAITETVRVDTSEMVTFDPVSFHWPPSLRVRIEPFRWDYCQILLESPLSDPQHLCQWFERWFDVEDAHPAGEDGLLGVVHFLSDPAEREGKVLLSADLGSAPVEALEDLFDALAASGQDSLAIGQYEAS